MSTSINSLIEELVGLREEIREVNAHKSDLEKEKEEVELTIMSLLDEQEVTLMRGQHATISISETENAKVEDWDEFEKYIYDNRALYLLQRRPSNPAYRELVKTDGSIPGVISFTKRTINLRKN